MKCYLISLFLILGSLLFAQDKEIDQAADELKKQQLLDESLDWEHFGTFNFNLQGIDNSASTYLNIDAHTTVRMYMLAKTECYMYFEVRDKDEAYIFGTNDEMSLETEYDGFKAATSFHTYENQSVMNINFGIRWGCPNMLDTPMRLLVFYVNKNSK